MWIHELLLHWFLSHTQIFTTQTNRQTDRQIFYLLTSATTSSFSFHSLQLLRPRVISLLKPKIESEYTLNNSIRPSAGRTHAHRQTYTPSSPYPALHSDLLPSPLPLSVSPKQKPNTIEYTVNNSIRPSDGRHAHRQTYTPSSPYPAVYPDLLHSPLPLSFLPPFLLSP